ncbi:two-component regulator propeller domain-containing protein [Rhodohalobacter barkolensis]|nr:two-component regulator propeller domain-containing protein [Rhodohalobacter barkolensis]
MKRTILSLVALIALLPGASEGQVLPFTHYTPENEVNPLPSAEVTSVYQDKLGYMWFSIYSSGIVRYDGVKMEVYGLDDGLSDLYIWDLKEDSTGRLWISSNAGIVVSEEPLDKYGIGEKVRFVNRFGDTELINVAVNHNNLDIDNDGIIWVGTENLGVVRYRFSSDSELESDTLSTTYDGSTVNVAVRSLVARKDNSVWVALLGGDLLKYENGIVSATYTTGSQIDVNILYESPYGTLWGVEQAGSIWKLDETNSEPNFIFLNSSATSNIQHITMGSDGILWVSREGTGLQKIDSDTNDLLTTYSRENGLLTEVIYSVFEDRENNIWIAQSGGVSKLRYNYKAFRNLTSTSIAGEKPVLPSPSVNSVLPSYHHNNPCTFWGGTAQGGVTCINSDFESESIQQDDGLTGNWVNGLAYDLSGRLWIGTSRGLNSISFSDSEPLSEASYSTDITLFDTSAKLSTYPASSVLAAEKLLILENSESQRTLESLWFPAYQEVYAVINDKFFTLAEKNNLPAAIFHAVAFDDEGYLWVGTRDRGIHRSTKPITYEGLSLNESSEQPDILFEPWWSVDLGAPSNQIEKMLWLDGMMWVGTPSGLSVLEGGTISTGYFISTSDGLPANNATSFAVSPVTGMVWVGTNNGLAEIDPETGSVLKTVSKVDGLVDNEVWFYGSVQFDPDGILYYGTAKGITLYNPPLDKINSTPPTLKLTQFATQEIDGERNEFTFEYAALSFGNERQVRYQTRLVGFSSEWTPLKTDTRINYTNLSAIFLPKTYRFEVIAYNEHEVPSTEALTFEFPVSPPLYLTWWAFLIYFILFSAGVFVVDRFQRARLLKKERDASHLREAQLKAETAEAQSKVLQAENELKAAELEKAKELEIAYHELKATQKRLIQAEKMASLGRLSTGIAHEIKNPLNFINNFSEVSKELVDELKIAIDNSDQEEIAYILKNLSFNTQKIDEHGKRADAIVRSMMQHSRGGQGDFESVQLNQLIKEFADLAYQGKKSLINNLDILIHTELDSTITEVNIIPQKVGQVLQNIVENAIDSTWEHKKNSDSDFRPEIKISSFQKNGHTVIKVSDNGPGIPEHIKEKIFEPFFTTKPTGEGTGLGLSLSYDFITQIHNGKLELGDSELGGAAFIIRLPNSTSNTGLLN